MATKKAATKKKPEIVVSYILDESGSMSDNKAVTISAFNEYLASLHDMQEKIRFAFTKFNSQGIRVVYSGVPLEDVKPLTDKTYTPSSMTPLYDAIGTTLAVLGSEKGRVLVVIQSDGLENVSKDYNRGQVFKMIEEKRKAGWEFVFLGANQDSFIEGEALGIPAGNTANYLGSHGTRDPLMQATQSYVSAVVRQDADTTHLLTQKEAKS